MMRSIALILGFLLGATPLLASRYDQALAAFYQADYKTASRLLRKIDARRYPESLILAAMTASKQGAVRKAFGFLDRSSVPDSYQNYLSLIKIRLYLSSDQFEKAEAEFKSITEGADVFVLHAASFEFGSYAFKHNQFEKSKVYLRQNLDSLTDQDLTIQSHRLLFQMAIQQKKKSEAIASYIAMLKKDATIDSHNDYWKQLKPLLGPRIKSKIDLFVNGSDLLDYSEGLVKKNRLDSAKQALTRVFDYHLDSAQRGKARSLLGRTYYFQYHFGPAIRQLRQALKTRVPEPERYRAQFYLARSYQRSKKYQSAKKQFSQIIRMSDHPYRPASFYHLATVHRRLGNTSEYNRLLNRFQSEYDDSDYYNRLVWERGWREIKDRNWSNALAHFEKMSTKSPGDRLKSKILFWHGKVLGFLGKPGKEKQFWKTHLTSYPLTYYSYRTHQDHRSDTIQRALSDMPTQPLPIADRYRWLIRVGLGDLAVTQLKYDYQTDANPETSVALAWSLSQTHQYYDGVVSLAKLMAGESGKSKVMTQEMYEISYPLAYWNEVRAISKKYKVDPLLVTAIMREESLFKPTIRSRAKAVGLMQIMPRTGQEIAGRLKEKWGGTRSLESPDRNIRYGAYYFSRLTRAYDGDLMLALSAYNAGPGRTRKWIKKYGTRDMDMFLAKIPYPETKRYIQKVLENYWIYSILYDS